jgi:CRISPR-associated endonuclease/helicase Cas3
MKKFYAHSVEGRPLDEWHSLEEHLKGTAELSAKFADAFGSGEWGYLAGLQHDLRRKG